MEETDTITTERLGMSEEPSKKEETVKLDKIALRIDNIFFVVFITIIVAAGIGFGLVGVIVAEELAFIAMVAAFTFLYIVAMYGFYKFRIKKTKGEDTRENLISGYSRVWLLRAGTSGAGALVVIFIELTVTQTPSNLLFILVAILAGFCLYSIYVLYRIRKEKSIEVQEKKEVEYQDF